MGQMGNSEEAIMPDDLPFSIEDLDMEEEPEYNMASGGVIKAANGTFTTGGGYKVADPITTGYTAPQPQQFQQFQPYVPQFKTATATEGAFQPKTLDPVVPTSSDFLGKNVPGVDFEYVTYVNDAGQTIQLRKDKATGELLDPIPEGFRLQTDAVQSTKTSTTGVDTTSVREQDNEGGDFDPSKPTTISFGGEIAKTGRNKGLVQGAFRAGVSFTGIGLSDIRGMMGAGFSSLAESLSGGKIGQPLSLSGNQGAILSNIIDPTTKVGVSPASALGFNLALNAEQYNKYITRSGPVKTTDRQELAGIVRELSKIDDVLQGETLDMSRANYLAYSIRTTGADDVRDSIEKSKGVDKYISDALGRDRGKVSGSGIFGTDIGAEDRTGAVSAEERAEMTDQEKQAVDAAMTAYAETMSTEEDDDYEGAEADAAAANAAAGIDSGPTPEPAAEGQFGDFNKGGLAKQMKRSGLASKK
tara:strand:- start:50 stop:1465 length:1416 start_codon:yes stop_codon:yes gene_type:complete